MNGTGLYALLAVERHSGVIEVHLNSRRQPWTTTTGAGRIMQQLIEQRGVAWQFTIVPAVQS